MTHAPFPFCLWGSTVTHAPFPFCLWRQASGEICLCHRYRTDIRPNESGERFVHFSTRPHRDIEPSITTDSGWREETTFESLISHGMTRIHFDTPIGYCDIDFMLTAEDGYNHIWTGVNLCLINYVDISYNADEHNYFASLR